MKISCLVFCVILALNASANKNSEDQQVSFCAKTAAKIIKFIFLKFPRDLARSDEPLMVLVTLSGSMIAIDPQTANLRWFQQHDPVIKSNNNEKLNFSSILLPNPVSGQLYSLKAAGSDDFELSRLDQTIPDLVLKSPFISKDQVLYTGRKADSWFIINSKTGECKTVMGMSSINFLVPDMC